MIRLQDFKQIVECKGNEECNKWLQQGWVIAKIKEGVDGFEYVLGLPKKEV